MAMAFLLRRLLPPPRLACQLHSTRKYFSDLNQCISALSRPSWSVRTLLPPDSPTSIIPEATEITPERLRHLLRLAALPPPSSPEEEANLLKTLLDQLHFVKDVQAVDTTGFEPLQMIRDEVNPREFDIAHVKEKPIGERQAAREAEDLQGRVKWDVLERASKTVGRYLVVDDIPEAAEADEFLEERVQKQVLNEVERGLEGKGN